MYTLRVTDNSPDLRRPLIQMSTVNTVALEVQQHSQHGSFVVLFFTRGHITWEAGERPTKNALILGSYLA